MIMIMITIIPSLDQNDRKLYLISYQPNRSDQKSVH